MRPTHSRSTLVASLLLLAAFLTQADRSNAKGAGSTRPPTGFAALSDGAVLETRLRIAPGRTEEFLRYYATWYLPVDSRDDSGRRLVSIVVPEFGDDADLVFTFRYESRYKQDYYCKYATQFFRAHRDKISQDRARLADAESALLSCGGDPRKIPALVDEALALHDREMRAMVVHEESTWSFPLDLAQIQAGKFP